MPSKNSLPGDPLPPFGALPQTGPGAIGQNPPSGTEGPAGRNRRLLWWLWGSLPFIVIAFILGVALVGLYLWSWSALRGFEREDLGATEASYQRQVSVTGIGPSPWVALYNLGSIQLLSGQVTSGLENLEQAYQTVPKAIPTEDGSIQTFTYECRVRLNLAVGWETVGDQQYADGDLDVAIETYDRALEWSTPCQGVSDSSQFEQQEGESGGGGGESDQVDEGASTSERIDQKRQQAQRDLDGESAQEPENGQQNSDSSGTDNDENSGEGNQQESENPFAGETEQERERRESLEEKNRQQQESQREREEVTSRNPGSAGW